MIVTENNLVQVVIKGSLLLLALLTVIAFAVFRPADGLGVLAGGSIAILNFIWQRHALHTVLLHRPKRPALYSTLRFVTRLAAVSAALFLVIKSGLASIAGLLTGLSVIVAVIIICTVYFAVHHKGV